MSGPPSRAEPELPPARSIALDALRGLAIAAMILANNPGRWGAQWQYAPLRHAAWHGCTFTDLVFPTFLFCVGAAIVPALERRRGAVPRAVLAVRIVRRGAVLVLLGLLLHAFPFVTFAEGRGVWSPVTDVRVPGVLQRIGVCYALAALLVAFASVGTQRAVLLACLLGHWVVSVAVPVPGVGMPDLDDPARTLQGWLDRAVFGSHVWRASGVYDPEGLLSTAPALATVLLGVSAGRVLVGTGEHAARAYGLLRLGALWLAAGAVWGWFLPWNKPLWTGSFAVGTAGIAALGLGLAVWAFEERGGARLAHPLRVYGVNALLVFVGSGVLARVLGLVDVDGTGGTPHAKDWFFTKVLLGPIGDPKLASLAFGALWILGWYAVLAALWRRGVVWKV